MRYRGLPPEPGFQPVKPKGERQIGRYILKNSAEGWRGGVNAALKRVQLLREKTDNGFELIGIVHPVMIKTEASHAWRPRAIYSFSAYLL